MHYSKFFKSIPRELKGLFEQSEYVWDVLKVLRDWVDTATGGKVVMGKDVLVEEGALIEGPCWIGSGCKILHGAAVRPYTVLCDGAVIGHCTEVKRSILLEGAKAPHFNYIGDSILGANVNMGAGAKTANLRFDGKVIKVDGIDTGLRKFGVILGDSAQVGCNCILGPGCLIDPNRLCRPCSYVGAG